MASNTEIVMPACSEPACAFAPSNSLKLRPCSGFTTDVSALHSPSSRVAWHRSQHPHTSGSQKRRARIIFCGQSYTENGDRPGSFRQPEALPPGTVALLWLRNDLRLRDHAPLSLGCTADLLAPLYVFDTTKYGYRNRSRWGFQRCGPFRAEFVVNSVSEVSKRLRRKGCDLYIRHGNAVEEVLSLARDLVTKLEKPVAIIAHKEYVWEDVRAELQIESGAKSLSDESGIPVDVHWIWSGTLHHPADLPFDVTSSGVPPTLTQYRELVFPEEGDAIPVRDLAQLPDRLPRFPLSLRLRTDGLPSLRTDLEVEGLCAPLDFPFPCPLAAMEFEGGIEFADDRIKEYITIGQDFLFYSERCELSGRRNTTTKLSPWISAGCMSPREVYWILRGVENQPNAKQPIRQILLQLIARDYYRWVALTYGERLFALNGFSKLTAKEAPIWKLPPGRVKQGERDRLAKWMDGMTGAPFVDAAMRELKKTGFMSNRSRRNVASFLIHDLEFPDWRAGAEYFESKLIDYDPASNWCNWAYLAGVGSDPSVAHKLNVIEESIVYDDDGFFLTRWLPELLFVPPAEIHQPHLLSDEELEAHDVLEGYYPKPVVPLPTAAEELVEPLRKLEGVERDLEWAERVKNDFIEAGAGDVTRLT